MKKTYDRLAAGERIRLKRNLLGFTLAIVLSVISDSLFTLLLPIVILILLIPYIRHYYILENEVQKMYGQYDRMRRLQQTAAGSKIEKPER